MIKLNSCCCCFKIKTGAYIIGALHLFFIIWNILELNIFGIAMELFTAATFVNMIRKDTALHRKIYAASFCVYTLILTALEIFIVVDPFSKTQRPLITEKCEEFANKEGTLEQFGFNSKKDCIT